MNRSGLVVSIVAVGLAGGWSEAMAASASWQLGRAKQEMKSDWDFIPYPRSPATGRSASRLSIEALGLAKDAAGAQDALQLVQLGASRNAQEALLQAGTIAIPVRRDLMDSPYFYPPEETPNSARRVFTEALTQGYAVPETVYPDLQMRTVMEQHVKTILLGQEAPKSGLEAAAQQIAGISSDGQPRRHQVIDLGYRRRCRRNLGRCRCNPGAA